MVSTDPAGSGVSRKVNIMKTFQITKKNRKYFAAKLEGKYPCKILIDADSESLEPGEHTLEVEDISVRSKYGTDLIFKLKGSVEEQQDAGICTLRSDRYNSELTEACRNLGGKWDGEEKVWVFSGMVADEVEALDVRYNSQLVTVELTNEDAVSQWHGPVEFLGFSLARAYGRDSGAKLADGVAVIEGGARSGGSVKNWTTVMSAGSVLRLQIPSALLDGDTAGRADGFDFRVIS